MRSGVGFVGVVFFYFCGVVCLVGLVVGVEVGFD